MGASNAIVQSKGTDWRVFFERFWRSAGIQFAFLFLVAYFVFGDPPSIGAPAPALAAFYEGGRTRILIGAVVSGLAILNLMWFAAAIRVTLVDAGQDGWGAAATASSAVVGGFALLYVALAAALAYSIAASGNSSLASVLNDFAWACVVLSSFPRAMLIMSGTFGLWRASLISNGLFAAGVAFVVLELLGGTTWMSGAWAPDGAYTRYISPGLCIAWVLAMSGFLLGRASSTRTGW